MKRPLAFALGVFAGALLTASLASAANIVVGGTVDSTTATVNRGCFTRQGTTFYWSSVEGTANYTDGGEAFDWKPKPAECVSTGGTIAQGWSNALTVCPAAWKAVNGL